jgi:hypothetical protein
MKALIAEFGYEGYGRFWVLNERIAESSGACIDISKKVNKLDIAQELGLNGDGLDKFLAFLSDPEIDLINIEDNIITTDRISELFEKTMESRETERDRKKSKTGKDDFPDGKEDFPHDFHPEIHTDKTRQDKTKQDKNLHPKNDPKNIIMSRNFDEALNLAKTMLLEHRKEIPDFMTGKKDEETIKRWAQDIEKLIRIDKKSPENIGKVIMWVKTPGNFWFHNIESGMKLRKQYERLYGQMISRNGQGPPSYSLDDKKSLGGLEL